MQGGYYLTIEENKMVTPDILITLYFNVISEKQMDLEEPEGRTKRSKKIIENNDSV